MSGNEDNDAEQEDVLLRGYSDVITRVTMESTPTLLAVLQQLNTNMASMGESIKQLHSANAIGETQAPKKAESANKRKSQATNSSEPGQSSDADDLLADTSKRQKTANNERDNTACGDGADKDDSLLDEIAQSLSETEKTEPKVLQKS